MKETERASIIRIASDIVRSDAIIDIRELIFLDQLRTKYSITIEDERKSFSMTLQEAVSCLQESQKSFRQDFFCDMVHAIMSDNIGAEIENRLGKTEIGGYLVKLEKYYSLIVKKRPIFSKENSKQVRYSIEDNFLTFWFRFIYRYQGYIEAGALPLLEGIIKRDYNVFSGMMLERYFRDKFRQKGIYTQIGTYWNRKGENEIDLILLNELDKSAFIYEVKRDGSRYSQSLLEKKVTALSEAEGELKKYTTQIGKLSMEDM